MLGVSPFIIDIRDSESNHLALLTTADLPKGYSWTCNKFNIASIKNPAGQVIGQLQIKVHPSNYQLIRYQNKIYLIPRRAQQRQASSTTSSATPPRYGAHQTSAPAYRSIAPNPFYQARAAFSQTSRAPIQRPAYPTKDEAISQRSKEKGTLAEALRAAEAEDYNRPSSFPGQPRLAAKRTPNSVQPTAPMNVAGQRPFSVIDLTGDPQNLPALPDQSNSMNVEKPQHEALSTREQVSTQKAMENVGQKRAREDDTTEHPAKRAKRDFDPKSVAYWRIDPEQTGYFQLCGADGTVLHTKKVRTHMGYRKLTDGYLRLQIKEKQRKLKRDPQDTARLTDHGFEAGSNNNFKVYGQAYSRADPDADAIDPKTVAYWRIHPDQKGYLQLCDQNGTVLHTEAVKTRQGERKLARGYLQLKINGKQHRFRRDPKDNTDLTENGFAPGQIATIWKQSTAKGVAEDLMDCEQETGVDNAVTVSPSTHYNSETDDDEELSDDLLEFCDLLEEELSNDLLKFRNLLEETLASNS